MEYLKTCTTNAQAIGDFEAISFQAFSVAPNPPQSAAREYDWAPADDIRAAEAQLRQERHLVVQDASKPWLWLFRPATIDQASQKPSDLPVLEGFRFQRERYGLMKAADLAKMPLRSQSANPAASTNSPLTPSSAKSIPGTSRLAHANPQASNNTDPPQQYDGFAIYDMFMSAVVALISFHLVKDYKAIALNYRTFVSKPIAEPGAKDQQIKTSTTLLSLTNLNVYWATSGTLVVSTFSLIKPEVHCLDEITNEDERNQVLGRCIRVAPSGTLAKITGFDDPLDAVDNHVSQRPQRKRARVGQAEHGVERWKSTVKRWLAWKGYSISDLDRVASWVRIQIAHSNPTAMPSPASSQFRDILWPRALCFYYTQLSPRDTARSGKGLADPGELALKWFETVHSAGYRDPLELAQQWYLGKPERDKIIEARRRAKKAEEDAVRLKEEGQGHLASSPLNARSGAYGDLQAVSGVYPTPPDGVAPGTAISTSDTPNVVSAAINVILVPGGNNPTINLSAPQETHHSDAQQLTSTSPTFAVSFDQYNTAGGDDDLFEDIEEDDFNFFDEPDGEDVDMPDASNADNSKALATQEPAAQKPAPAVCEAEITEEPPDVFTALDNALATASGNAEGQHTDATERGQAKNGPVAEPDRVQPAIVAPASLRNELNFPVSKEPTPPLSPSFIEKSLLPSPKSKLALQTPQKPTPLHRDSIFDPLSFNRKMSLSDSKYQEGRFSFPHGNAEKGNDEEDKVTHRPKSLRDLPLLTKLRYAIGAASVKGIPEVSALAREDSDLSDTSSEASSDEEDTEDVDSIGPKSISRVSMIPSKRKIHADGNATPLSATSFADSLAGEFSDTIGLETDEAALTTLEPTAWDWSLVNIPAPMEIPASNTRYTIPTFSPVLSSMPNTPTSQPDIPPEPVEERSLSGKDTIVIAQIVTDQIVLTTLDLIHDNAAKALSARMPSETRWRLAVKDVFPKAIDCNVTTFASVADVFPDLPQQKGQPRQPARKPNEGPATLGHLMLQVNTPYIRVRRADALWDLLPPAIPFWEPLGLSPCSPAKNVVAFCIYPHSDGLRSCVQNFMLNVQLAYDGCRLGTHTSVETIPGYEGGLVPCKMDRPVTSRTAFKALRDTCMQFGKLLAAKYAHMRDKEEPKVDAFVIYMVDPFETPSAIWEMCSAFWSLFQAYGPGPPSRDSRPDLVLQLVPIKYVASFEAPVILDSSIYTLLAREVYDRCPPNAPSEEKTPLSIYTAPSFQLEEPIPKNIQFKLQAEPPQDLLHENSYIHIGYAISLDGTWITVAWTDTCGKSQAVVSYHLGTRMFREVAKEIWQTTIEILQVRKVLWRVCVAKAGVMDREEMEAWVFLIMCPTQVNLFVTLLTVDINPPLKFTPTIPPTNTASSSSAAYPGANTPGSTPQAGVSPEHGLTPAATPSADTAADPATDPDARLVDSTDETWSIVLAHRLHNSNSTNEFRPALISGLLVKRGLPSTSHSIVSNTPFTPDPERGPIIVAVNMLWMGAINPTRAATSPFPPASSDGISPGGVAGGPAGQSAQDRGPSTLMWTPTVGTRAAAENLMKEVLAQYRGLGLLARLRGMRGTRHGSVPWHVAAAVSGVKGLSRCAPA